MRRASEIGSVRRADARPYETAEKVLRREIRTGAHQLDRGPAKRPALLSSAAFGHAYALLHGSVVMLLCGKQRRMRDEEGPVTKLWRIGRV